MRLWSSLLVSKSMQTISLTISIQTTPYSRSASTDKTASKSKISTSRTQTSFSIANVKKCASSTIQFCPLHLIWIMESPSTPTLVMKKTTENYYSSTVSWKRQRILMIFASISENLSSFHTCNQVSFQQRRRQMVVSKLLPKNELKNLAFSVKIKEKINRL